MQGRVAVEHQLGGPGTGVDQHLDDKGVVVLGGDVDRGAAVLLGLVDLRLGLDERLDDLQLAAPGGDVDRGGAILFGLIDLRLSLNEPSCPS